MKKCFFAGLILACSLVLTSCVAGDSSDPIAFNDSDNLQSEQDVVPEKEVVDKDLVADVDTTPTPLDEDVVADVTPIPEEDPIPDNEPPAPDADVDTPKSMACLLHCQMPQSLENYTTQMSDNAAKQVHKQCGQTDNCGGDCGVCSYGVCSEMVGVCVDNSYLQITLEKKPKLPEDIAGQFAYINEFTTTELTKEYARFSAKYTAKKFDSATTAFVDAPVAENDKFVFEVRSTDMFNLLTGDLGIYELGKNENANYKTCKQCFLVKKGLKEDGTAEKTFFQRSGTVVMVYVKKEAALNPKNALFTDLTQLFLKHAVLEEVTIDATGNSTPVPNGEVIQISEPVFMDKRTKYPPRI